MAVTIYGIANCDTVKKARKWLDAHDIAHGFHDFRADGLAREQVETWIGEIGWETLVNRRSSSWRELDQGLKDELDNASAVDLIMNAPTLIKRPLTDTGSARYVGFSDKAYAEIFA